MAGIYYQPVIIKKNGIPCGVKMMRLDPNKLKQVPNANDLPPCDTHISSFTHTPQMQNTPMKEMEKPIIVPQYMPPQPDEPNYYVPSLWAINFGEKSNKTKAELAKGKWTGLESRPVPKDW